MEIWFGIFPIAKYILMIRNLENMENLKEYQVVILPFPKEKHFDLFSSSSFSLIKKNVDILASLFIYLPMYPSACSFNLAI